MIPERIKEKIKKIAHSNAAYIDKRLYLERVFLFEQLLTDCYEDKLRAVSEAYDKGWGNGRSISEGFLSEDQLKENYVQSIPLVTKPE